MPDETYELYRQEQCKNLDRLQAVLTKYVEAVADPERMYSVPPEAFGSLPGVAEILLKIILRDI